MSDRQPQLPGPRELFPDLFQDDRNARDRRSTVSAGGTGQKLPSATSVPSPQTSHRPKAPEAPSSHSQRARDTLTRPSTSQGSCTTMSATADRGQPAHSRSAPGPSQQQATLRPAQWTSLGTPSESPTDKKLRYPCSVCGKRFERPSSRDTHSVTHTGERPFECIAPGCSKAFSTKSNMQRHMRNHHP